jgi:hypothetical protein
VTSLHPKPQPRSAIERFVQDLVQYNNYQLGLYTTLIFLINFVIRHNYLLPWVLVLAVSYWLYRAAIPHRALILGGLMVAAAFASFFLFSEPSHAVFLSQLQDYVQNDLIPNTTDNTSARYKLFTNMIFAGLRLVVIAVVVSGAVQLVNFQRGGGQGEMGSLVGLAMLAVAVVVTIDVLSFLVVPA